MDLSGTRAFFSSWRHYKIAFNWIMLVLALLLTVMLLSIILIPSFSSKIEHFALEQYTEYYQEKEQQALQAERQDNMTLFADILRAYFADIQKGDRVYPQKRELLLRLCAYLYSQQDYAELLRWAAVWFQLDERDITALAYYYQALWITEHNEDALLKLQQVSERFPKHLLLKEFNQVNLVESSVGK